MKKITNWNRVEQQYCLRKNKGHQWGRDIPLSLFVLDSEKYFFWKRFSWKMFCFWIFGETNKKKQQQNCPPPLLLRELAPQGKDETLTRFHLLIKSSKKRSKLMIVDNLSCFEITRVVFNFNNTTIKEELKNQNSYNKRAPGFQVGKMAPQHFQ